MAKGRRKKSTTKAESSQNSGASDFRTELWGMADALRGSMDAAEYKHVVLGLIFLKYISDAFEEAHAKLMDEVAEGADPEDPDEYRAKNIFWVPPEARWPKLQSQARQPTIGRTMDDAMIAIERDNPALKDVLPKIYARQELDKTSLGQVVDLVSNIKVGGAEARATDVLGSVYEYFLEQFALAEGRKGGEFYTPRSIVRLLVEMLKPYEGRVYDPCCGSSGMFVQSMAFIDAHTSGIPSPGASRHPLPKGEGLTGRGSAREKISIYGQESNYTTWRMARMNLAIRGIEGQIAHGDSFHNDRHPGPEGRLHPRQSALQRLRLGRRSSAGRQTMGVRRPSRWQCQLRVGTALPAPPFAARHRRLRPRQRLHVVEPIRRGHNQKEHHRGQPGGLHRRPARTVVPVHADTCVSVVFVKGALTRRFAPPSPRGRGSFCGGGDRQWQPERSTAPLRHRGRGSLQRWAGVFRVAGTGSRDENEGDSCGSFRMGVVPGPAIPWSQIPASTSDRQLYR